MDVIKIRGLEISACHGVMNFEKVTPQTFIFDADLYVDFYHAFLSDDLNYTVNYASVCELIKRIATSNTFNLIEKLAYECAYTILEYFSLNRVVLTVYKPNAPVAQKFEHIGATAEVERTRAFLALGSSMGDREAYLNEGLKKLSLTRGITVKKMSSYFRTKPVGGVAQNEFLNGACEIETFLSPQNLLGEIHRIESECGRVRNAHWGDRTLDIDIIFYGNKIIREEGLIIPHPEYHKRRFVIEPLRQIAPEFICPVLNKKIKEL